MVLHVGSEKEHPVREQLAHSVPSVQAEEDDVHGTKSCNAL